MGFAEIDVELLRYWIKDEDKAGKEYEAFAKTLEEISPKFAKIYRAMAKQEFGHRDRNRKLLDEVLEARKVLIHVRT